MTNIQRPDIETAKTVLSNAYKSGLIPFYAQSVEPYCEGGGALTLKCLDADGTEYCVRFPNTAQKLDNMRQELEILQFLKAEHLSETSGLRIPETHFAQDAQYPFIWHRAIVGEILLPQQYDKLTEPQKSNFARKIAKFLHAMHTCKLPKGNQCNDTIIFQIAETQLNGFDVLRNKLPEQILNKYKALKLHTDYPSTLCHFDMHGRNMAIDPKTKDLIGIFDFGDTSVRKCFLDFYKLSVIHRDLTRRVIDEYNKISDIKIDIHDVDLAYLCDMAIKYARSPNDGIINKSLENFIQDISPVQNFNMVKSHKI